MPSEVPILRAEFVTEVAVEADDAQAKTRLARQHNVGSLPSLDPARAGIFQVLRSGGDIDGIAASAAKRIGDQERRRSIERAISRTKSLFEFAATDAAHLADRSFFQLNSSIRVPVDNVIIRVVSGKPSLWWPQLWKSGMTYEQLAMMIVFIAGAVRDYDPQLVSASIGVIDYAEVRQREEGVPKLIYESELPTLDRDRFLLLASRFIRAHEALCKENFRPRQRREKHDPRQGTFEY